jgi:hypothetical protein
MVHLPAACKLFNVDDMFLASSFQNSPRADLWSSFRQLFLKVHAETSHGFVGLFEPVRGINSGGRFMGFLFFFLNIRQFGGFKIGADPQHGSPSFCCLNSNLKDMMVALSVFPKRLQLRQMSLLLSTLPKYTQN